jgi:hypothetical protein
MYWIHERNLESLMSLYSDDAALESYSCVGVRRAIAIGVLTGKH